MDLMSCFTAPVEDSSGNSSPGGYPRRDRPLARQVPRYDPSGRQVKAPCDAGFTGGTANAWRHLRHGPARLQQPATRFPMNGAIYPSSTQHPFVGGVHDGVTVKLSDNALQWPRFFPSSRLLLINVQPAEKGFSFSTQTLQLIDYSVDSILQQFLVEVDEQTKSQVS